MPRTSIRFDPVEIPINVSVSRSKGYVYYNTTTEWVPMKSNPQKKHATHKKVIIGKALIVGENWNTDRRMVPNSNYFLIFAKDQIPEQPNRNTNISVGIYAAIRKLAMDSGLTEELLKVFSEEEAYLMLDLSMFMLSAKSAVFQEYPHWGRSHAIFSESVRSDSYISRFQKGSISLSRINLFNELWAKRAIDDGKLYFCYDSTNINSQSEGVFLVQKGHAKDDNSLEQVNVDYVVRQRDGLPVTFKVFPGAIIDMVEATEMLKFLGTLKDLKNSSITIICDRGYISEDNVQRMDDASLNFLLMLKSNMNVTKDLLKKYAASVRSSAHYIPESDQYGMTVTDQLFVGDTRTRYFHIVWSSDREKEDRKTFFTKLATKELRLRRKIERKEQVTYDEMMDFADWFKLRSTKAGTVPDNKKGRQASGQTKEEESYVINSAERDVKNIDECAKKFGFRIMVSSEKMDNREAMEAYSKRDCVEKVFSALKSTLGMEKIGVYSDDSMHTKMLIWFLASILHSLIFNRTMELREKDRKSFTVRSIINLLEEISADEDLNTGKYKRRFKPIRKQNRIMKCLGVTIDDIDSCIDKL